ETNILHASVQELNNEVVSIKIGQHLFRIPNTEQFNKGDRIHLSIRPENIHYSSKLNQDETQLKAVIKEVIYSGSVTKIVTELPDEQQVVIQSTNGESLHIGDTLYIHWQHSDTSYHPFEREEISL